MKNRRDVFGGARGPGHRHPGQVHRRDARAMAVGPPDPSLTAFGGLAAFDTFLRDDGIDAALAKMSARFKTGPNVVYPMHSQVRLLLDLLVLGGTRVFDLERCAHDPLVRALNGDAICSLDTLYRDVERFDETAIGALDTLLGEVCVRTLRRQRLARVHLDIDTTVNEVTGTGIEGAVVGYNPLHHGLRGYHPILARVAECDLFVSAKLRAGNTTFGAAEAPFVGSAVRCVRKAIGPHCLLYVRIDKAGACGELLCEVANARAFFLVKAPLDSDIKAAIASVTTWTTTHEDAEGQPLEQLAEVTLARAAWMKLGLAPVRMLIVRSSQRQGGRQLWLWPELEDMTVQVLLTNDMLSDAADLVEEYDGRAGIEPLIGEQKQAWGMGHISSTSFLANEAMLLLKLLAHNVLRRMALALGPKLTPRWRSLWLRALLIMRPAKLVRSGRKLRLRFGPGPTLVQRE